MTARAVRWARRNLAAQYAARLPVRPVGVGVGVGGSTTSTAGEDGERVVSGTFLWPPGPLLLAVQPHLDDDLFGHTGLLAAAEEEEEEEEGGKRKGQASPAYQRSFLKALLERIQDALAHDPDGELEVDERLVQRYTALLASSASSASTAAGPPAASAIQYVYPAAGHRHSGHAAADSVLAGLNAVVLHESGTIISQGTTGLRTWEASLALAAHILASQPDPLPPDNPTTSPPPSDALWSAITRRGARVLELGSGVGMLGVLCAQIQRDHFQAPGPEGLQPSASSGVEHHVFLTDVPGPVLGALAETVDRNGLASSPHVSIAPLDWVQLADERAEAQGAAEGDETAGPSLQDWLRTKVRPSIVLAADVVFDPSLCAPLAQTLRAALEAGQGAPTRSPGDRHPTSSGAATGGGPSSPAAYVASTVRNQDTYRVFLDALADQHLSWTKLELSPHRQRLPPPPAPSLDNVGAVAPPHPRPEGAAAATDDDDEDDDDAALQALGPLAHVSVFPSAHDPRRDGHVELLRIQIIDYPHR